MNGPPGQHPCLEGPFFREIHHEQTDRERQKSLPGKKEHGDSAQDEHEAEQIAHRALDIVDLSERKNDPIRTYSKGMRQRTKLAQSIAHDPDILFLDEPLSGTDPIGRRRIIDFLLSPLYRYSDEAIREP